MAGQEGGGALWRDLGPLGHHDASYAGRIGESIGVATRRLCFSLAVPSTVFVSRLADDPGVVSFALQGPRRRRIPLDETGRARGVDIANTAGDESGERLPAGRYQVVISTRRWQEALFSFRLQVFPLASPAAEVRARGGLGLLKLSTIRPEVFATGRGGLRASLQPATSLSIKEVGRGQLRAGLQVIPSYEDPEPLGLGHAWFIRQGQALERLTVIASTGISFDSVDLPNPFSSYIPSRLTLDDFRQLPGQRVIFSDRSQDIYGAYPELGVNPAVTGLQISPDTPGIPFVRLTNGVHRREVFLCLPIENSRLLVIHLEERLAWNNDIVRDVDPTRPLVQLFVAVNRRSSFAHSRRVSAFVLDRQSCRRLARPSSPFLAQLDAILPPLDSFLVDGGVRVPGPSFSLPVVRILYPDFIAEGRQPSEGDRILGADPEDTTSGLLKSFGLTNLLKADSTMNSPAIYTLLENWEAIKEDDDYDPASTSFVISRLPDRPDGLAVLSPWYKDGAYRTSGGAPGAYLEQTDQLLRYGRWGGPLPARSDTGISSLDPLWTLAAQGLQLPQLRLFRSDSPKLLLAYDWGMAPYCQNKLQGLDFTGEDLSTVPPVTQGTARLNPGIPRPLKGQGRLYLGALTSSQTRNLRVAMGGQGSLNGSSLAWCLRVRIHSRGGLQCELAVTPDLTIVSRLLSGEMAGAGFLAADMRDRRSGLTGRGGFKPTRLTARPPNEFLQAPCTGRGGLQASLG
jgi:hypothetical protein